VLDILPGELRRTGLFPAGRLDKDTEGLVLITDDGDYAHKLLSPKSHVFKRYYAELDGAPDGETVRRFEEGITFADGTKCLPARLEIAENNAAFVEICEGKFHQVKKMFISCGLKVTYLKRLSIGGLELDGNLPIGNARKLAKTEKNAVFLVK
jgi:16S rRNA pseudouridine516 synthase